MPILKSKGTTVVPGIIGAAIVTCVYFWGNSLLTSVMGPTGQSLASFFALIGSPIAMAIGFGLGWSIEIFIGVLSHRFERLRALTALTVFIGCAGILYALIRTWTLDYWAISPRASPQQMLRAYYAAGPDRNICRLRALSINPGVSQDLVELLMQNKELHRWIAKNPGLPPETFRALSKERDSSHIVWELIHNPATPADVLQSLTTHKLQGRFAGEALKARGGKNP